MSSGAVVANGAQIGVPTSSRDRPPPQGQASQQQQPRRRTTITTVTGTWALGKTIGAGSMGKVKIAKNLETGEQVAIKIVPRQSTEDHHGRDGERADRSKEIRTAREAAMASLLNHPYICGMRDVQRTNYHWYMLFEYVNGGQMLDYIISHGRLKEKQARKFGRQIASALDYCHRNSIVHRDLKIENILISRTGDIKIIDFGLSNLYSPRSHLKTFCGSLYFAAPELLQARPYTGPEVDVWSFGIVLYVLVCGKVPFDDQSMPQLHAKIKKGVVDYPQWLSAECRSIISRMLVTDPKARATMSEIISHPWMTKGFNGPPDNYLPSREPVQLPLDQDVISRMTGFDFGPPEFIETKLREIVESESYQNAVRIMVRDQVTPSGSNEKKRGMFDFYKRRNSASRDTLTTPSADNVHTGYDPLNAYSPLLSIYQLVREKREREKREENPGAQELPIAPGEKPLKMPDLPAPEAAHTNQHSYELPGEKAAGGRSRPRARTHGDDEINDGMNKMNLSSAGGASAASPGLASPHAEHSKKENVATGLLRRFSTRRTKDRHAPELAPERSNLPQTAQHQQAPALQVQPPSDTVSAPRKSFSVRRSRRDGPPPAFENDGRNKQDYLSAPEGGSRSKALGRSTSVNSADYRTRRQARREAVELTDPPMTSGSDRSNASAQKLKQPEAAAAESTLHPRSATSRTKSLGHARRESIQARRARRETEAREANVPEETDAELAGDYSGGENSALGPDNMSKPVFLKGLFSVSTTSSKPLPAIRADIKRVLKQLNVDYTEIKGGFSCRHAPSIDLNKVVDMPPSQDPNPTPVSATALSHRRKISFGGFRGSEHSNGGNEDSGGLARHVSLHRSRRSQGPPDRSFITNSEGSEDYVADSTSHNTNQQQHSHSPPNPANRSYGETTTRVQTDTGSTLVLKFEILIVKVPLFSLHGIQFKKVSGGMWQYREMAKKILDGLRL